jgi:hypothetical protein
MAATNKSILVIEDDETVRTLLQRQLEGLYKVHLASDVAAALRMLETMPLPNLILSDVMMPGASGVDLAHHLKSNEAYKAIPIIFLTAKTGALDVIQGINAGARHYIAKPFKMPELLEKIAKALR